MLKEHEIESLSMLYTDAHIERSIKFFIKEDNPLDFMKVQKAIEDFRASSQKILELSSGLGGKTPSKVVQESSEK